MFSQGTKMNTLRIAVVAGALLLISNAALALDGYQDRKGPMGGISMGGGAVIQNGDAGGDMNFNLKLGGAPNERVTIALNLDFRFQFVDDYVNWMLVPGPEIDFFIVDNLFLSVGLGLAMYFPDDDRTEDTMKIGFDGGLGVGYEFFLSSNTAMAISIEGDYILVDDLDDGIFVGMRLGLRFY